MQISDILVEKMSTFGNLSENEIKQDLPLWMQCLPSIYNGQNMQMPHMLNLDVCDSVIGIYYSL